MPNLLTEKAQMNIFIQALYGVVLGVSLANLRLDWNVVTTCRGAEPVSQRFQLFLTLFTTVITAHDWFIFHLKFQRDRGGFGHFLPQIGSLFFVALMFNFSNYDHILEWYIAAGGYTLMNFIDVAIKAGTFSERPYSYPKYVLHAAVVTGVICLKGSIEELANITNTQYYTGALALTIAVVCLMWLYIDPRALEKEKKRYEAGQRTMPLGFLSSFQPVTKVNFESPVSTLGSEEKIFVLDKMKNGIVETGGIIVILVNEGLLDSNDEVKKKLYEEFITQSNKNMAVAGLNYLIQEINKFNPNIVQR
ncbi:MAG: hypothetical protein ABWZ25_08505 [Chitinophagaceae bacterium]